MGDKKNSSPNTTKRVPIWLPYLQSIEKQRGGIYEFAYNGGVEHIKLDQVSSIMLYGDVSASFNPKLIDEIVRQGIPIIIHRRNLAQPIVICGGSRPDPEDTLSAQLIKRQQSRVRTHVTRQLLTAKFRSMAWLVAPVPLPEYATVSQMRVIEAAHAKRYWKLYFERLGVPGATRRSDGEPPKNAYSVALDANSKFVSGVLLRWITYHHLSPYHAFLHEPTSYPALMYDLMEPYRGLIERELLLTWIREQTPKSDLVERGIKATKDWFSEKAYVPLTRQIVTNQELLHGIVLSLKFYLLGKQKKFHIPLPGQAKGGRPPKIEFSLYGRHAGKSDFWAQARMLSTENSDEVEEKIIKSLDEI